MNRFLRLAMSWTGIALLAAGPSLGADRPATRKAKPGADAGVADSAARAVATPPRPAVDVPAGAARRAFLDPQTGQLRQPTPEEAARLGAETRAARKRALAELEVVVHPDGSKSVDLKDAFLVDLVARRNPDGSLSIQCLPPGTRGGEKLPPAVAAAPALEEK